MENEKHFQISPEEAAKLIQELQQYRRNQEYIEGNHEKLMEMHANEWIAVDNEELVGSYKSFEDMAQAFDDGTLKRGSTLAIRFMDPDPKPMIVTPFKIYE